MWCTSLGMITESVFLIRSLLANDQFSCFQVRPFEECGNHAVFLIFIHLLEDLIKGTEWIGLFP